MTRLSLYSTDRHYAGSYANTVLYRLCEEHRRHEDVGIVAAKVGLLSRYYSASPKRGIGADREGDNVRFFDQFAQYLCCSDVDEWIKQANDVGVISFSNLNVIAKSHSQFSAAVVEFINDHWNEGTSNRSARNRKSFASKYLHFHAPDAFPLYDSVILSRLKIGAWITYEKFCERLIAVANDRFGIDNWTPRSVDKELYPYEAV